MANIGTADIGMAVVDNVVSAPGRRRSRVTLTIPNTTNVTYPAGGVPLSAPALGGLRGIVAAVKVIAQTPIAGDNNLLWDWNGSTTAPKLAAYRTAGAVSTPFGEFTGNLTQNANVITVEVEPG
jgi:hypothetical protein